MKPEISGPLYNGGVSYFYLSYVGNYAVYKSK